VSDGVLDGVVATRRVPENRPALNAEVLPQRLEVLQQQLQVEPITRRHRIRPQDTPLVRRDQPHALPEQLPLEVLEVIPAPMPMDEQQRRRLRRPVLGHKEIHPIDLHHPKTGAAPQVSTPARVR
jgi:hypothetical protein